MSCRFTNLADRGILIRKLDMIGRIEVCWWSPAFLESHWNSPRDPDIADSRTSNRIPSGSNRNPADDFPACILQHLLFVCCATACRRTAVFTPCDGKSARCPVCWCCGTVFGAGSLASTGQRFCASGKSGAGVRKSKTLPAVVYVGWPKSA